MQYWRRDLIALENIIGRVSLKRKMEGKGMVRSLQLEREETSRRNAVVDLKTYLENEAAGSRDAPREAEQLLTAGIPRLEHGEIATSPPSVLKRGYGLSTHDAAFNEDARVQLHTSNVAAGSGWFECAPGQPLRGDTAPLPATSSAIYVIAKKPLHAAGR